MAELVVLAVGRGRGRLKEAEVPVRQLFLASRPLQECWQLSSPCSPTAPSLATCAQAAFPRQTQHSGGGAGILNIPLWETRAGKSHMVSREVQGMGRDPQATQGLHGHPEQPGREEGIRRGPEPSRGYVTHPCCSLHSLCAGAHGTGPGP